MLPNGSSDGFTNRGASTKALEPRFYLPRAGGNDAGMRRAAERIRTALPIHVSRLSRSACEQPQQAPRHCPKRLPGAWQGRPCRSAQRRTAPLHGECAHQCAPFYEPTTQSPEGGREVMTKFLSPLGLADWALSGALAASGHFAVVLTAAHPQHGKAGLVQTFPA